MLDRSSVNMDLDNKHAAAAGIVVPCLQQREYQEVDGAMCDLLKTDWLVSPHFRFFVANALCGAIMLDPITSTALFVNTVEVYGRSRDIDVHCEQQTPTSASQRQYSFPPPHGIRYKSVWATTLVQAEGCKLVIRTRAFNALVTSSIRIGKHEQL